MGAWVARFVEDLGRRIGMPVQPRGERRYQLNWQGQLASMGSLAPDSVLQGPERAIWVDAKYKAHLSLLARHGWRGLGDAVRDAHRADLHQALAYASLANVERIDTILAYPHIAEDAAAPPVALATVASGRRRVRLILAGLPFGFARLVYGNRRWKRGGAGWQLERLPVSTLRSERSDPRETT